MSSPFTIIVLNAAGVVQGSGPLTTVTQLDDEVSLDGIGSLSFSLPANDPRYNLITAGSRFDVYDEQDGYLGQFIFKNRSLKETKRRGTVRINCYSVLYELSQEPLGFRRKYAFDPVESVAASLVSALPGWNAIIDSGIGNTSITFEGETILSGLGALASRFGVHYRISGSRTLEFGNFGGNSGVYVLGLEGQQQPDYNMRDYVAIVDSIEMTEDADWIVNTMIPLGAGQGLNQMTIEGAVTGDYPVLLFPNYDGTNTAYIQDATSLAAYGKRLRQTSFPNITPVSSDPTDIQNAKEAIKLTAEAYLKKHLNPKVDYALTVTGLRKAIKVGDTVHLTYQGTDRKNVYLDVDGDFYVTQITRQRNATGKRTASLTISTVNDRRQADTDIMVDVISDVRAMKVYYQPTAFRIEKTYTDVIAQSVANGIGGGGPKPAQFLLELDDSITTINKVILKFKTYPLWSGVEITAGTPVGERWQLHYGYRWPKRVTLQINFVDVSSQFGGPWNMSDEDTGLDVTCDITALIQAGGIHNRNFVQMYCADPASGLETRLDANHPSDVNLFHSHGIVEASFIVQGSSIGVIST